MSRRRWGALLGLALTLLFAALAVYNLDLSQVGTALARANYWLVFPAMLFTSLGYLVRTLRWRAILAPTKEIRVIRLFPVLVIGFAANNLLPVRMGEFVRAYLLGSQEEISKSLSFATIVVERVLDGLTLIGVLLGISIFIALPTLGQQVVYFAALIFLGATLALFVLLYHPTPFRRVLEALLRWAPAPLAVRLDRMALSFIQGVQALRQRRRLPALAILSLAVWLLEAGSYWVLTWAFSFTLSPAERPLAALLVLALANLGILIPSSPGYVGTFHFFAMSALIAFGAERELALSYAILSHATQYLLITGLGVVFLWRANLSLTRLGSEAAPES